MILLSGLGGIIVTATVILAIAAIGVISVRSYKKKLESGCCGGGSRIVRSKGVKDKNKSHYPYSVTIVIDGMVCTNCAHHIENSLNEAEGVWAVVDLDKKNALVRSKAELSDEFLRNTVSKAGYTVMKTSR